MLWRISYLEPVQSPVLTQSIQIFSYRSGVRYSILLTFHSLLWSTYLATQSRVACFLLFLLVLEVIEYYSGFFAWRVDMIHLAAAEIYKDREGCSCTHYVCVCVCTAIWLLLWMAGCIILLFSIKWCICGYRWCQHPGDKTVLTVHPFI